MIEQLRKEGVPEANLEYAAALMVGQGISESGLNASASHDGSTGYGIYGARLGPLTAMRHWLTSNGYAQNSLVGQAKFMVHEAMTSKAYGPTRDALLGASAANMAAATRTITRNFERPAVDNSGTRYRNSITALKAGKGQAQGFGTGATPFNDYGAGGDIFKDRWGIPNGIDPNLKRIYIGPRSSLDLLENGRQAGMMGGGSNGGGTSNLVVDFKDMSRGVRTSFNHDGMFKDVRLNRGHANQIAEG